jgi:hypothetical protein
MSLSFLNFKASVEVTQMYVVKLLSDPSKTMQEVRSALADLDPAHLHQIKLGDLQGLHTMLQHKEPFRDAKPKLSITEMAIAYLKERGEEVSAHDLAEHCNSSAQYVTRMLRDGFEGGTLPVMPLYRNQDKGRPEVWFRYLPGVAEKLDQINANKEVGT